MPDARPQTYANHGRLVPGYHYVAVPLILINVGVALAELADGVSVQTLNGLGLAAALVLVTFYARVNALKAQDRVIRLEERLRMERLLPADLAARIGDLTTAQIVALRFAGDDELADLTRRALDDSTAPKAIKQAIRDWRPDYQRV